MDADLVGADLSSTDLDISNLRKRIASRMVESKQHIPHFYVTSDVDVAAMLAFRQEINSRIADIIQDQVPDE